MEQTGISELPEEIVQHILYNFLTPKEAAQARLLSRAWFSAWRTCPFLRFDQPYFQNKFGPYKEQLHKVYFLKFVNKVLLNYHEQNHGIHTFKLRMNAHDSAHDQLVDEWVKIATENGLKKLHLCMFFLYPLPRIIFETRSLEDLFLDGCIFEQRYIGGVMWSNLRRLVLKNVSISDQVLQKVFTSCRLIEDLGIFQCRQLTNILVNNLADLKTFSVCYDPMQDIDIDAPSLESLTCEGDAYFGDVTPRMLSLVSSQNLKHLVFTGISMTDSFFDDFRIKLPCIEDLTVDNCPLLCSVRISSQSLKFIKLSCNKELKELQIDAPKIVQFDYEGESIPRVVITSCSGNWKSRILLSISISNDIDNSWFADLKELLTNLICSKIYLHIVTPKFVTFNLDEIRDGAVEPGPEIEMLSFGVPSIVLEPGVGSALLDGCFWTCHPKVIETSSFYHATVDLTKFLHQMLVDRRNHLQETKFWDKDLKDVKVVILERTGTRWQPGPLDWKALLEVDPYLSDDRRVIHFNLEW